MAVAFSKIQTLFEWCFRPDFKDKKHKGWKHPIFALFVMSLSSLITCSGLAARFIEKNPRLARDIPLGMRTKWGIFLFAYWMIMLCSRLATQKSRAFYDMLWACNISMLLAIYGLVKNSPLLVGASLVTIACDQLLWYVDCLGYLLFGKFYIGVAAYLKWPETTISTKLTSTHHLWFIPILVSILKKSGGLRTASFQISAGLTLILSILSRFMLPKTLPGPDGKDVYMNMNLSWEMWKDVKAEFLNKLLKDESMIKTLIANQTLWNSLNFFAFLLLKKVTQLLS